MVRFIGRTQIGPISPKHFIGPKPAPKGAPPPPPGQFTIGVQKQISNIGFGFGDNTTYGHFGTVTPAAYLGHNLVLAMQSNSFGIFYIGFQGIVPQSFFGQVVVNNPPGSLFNPYLSSAALLYSPGGIIAGSTVWFLSLPPGDPDWTVGETIVLQFS